MAKKDQRNASMSYKVDLRQIDGDGSFSCPKCGTVISPEDESEQVYKIVNTKVINDQLAELVIECTSCRSNITLTGLEATIEDLASK